MRPTPAYQIARTQAPATTGASSYDPSPTRGPRQETEIEGQTHAPASSTCSHSGPESPSDRLYEPLRGIPEERHDCDSEGPL